MSPTRLNQLVREIVIPKIQGMTPEEYMRLMDEHGYEKCRVEGECPFCECTREFYRRTAGERKVC